MNYLSNHGDSRQGQPPVSLSSSKSSHRPVTQKDEKSPEIGLADNAQSSIHSVRYKQRKQSNVNLPELTALDLEPQNEEQEIKLGDYNRNDPLQSKFN